MTTIYHNPRCSKSRQTLELLTENNINADVHLYLKEPLSSAELETLITALNIPATQLLRSKEKLIKELNINVASLTDAEAVALMAEHPVLMERPVVLHNNKAAIGRPPEQVLELF